MSRDIMLSIVTTTYNHQDYIRDALDSFMSQKTNFKFEVIISDDCSKDDTQSIISEYVELYPDIFKPNLRKKNIGAIPNTIEALRSAKGKYIALCEGDDFWVENNKLQKQVDFLESHPNYAICFNPTRVFFEKHNEEESVWPNISSPEFVTTESLLKENFIPTNSVVYRRQSYEKIPENVMPFDWYLHLFHAQFGKIGFINEIMSAYRRHEGSLWWGSYEDADKLWFTYGKSHIAMYLEVLKFFDNDNERKMIALACLGDVLIKMTLVDKRLKSHIVDDAISRYPESTRTLLDALILEAESMRENIIKVDLDNAEKEKELTEQVIALREQLHVVRDELHTLKNSRVFGKIIKLRDRVGVVRNTVIKTKNLPRRTIHKVRVVGAPFVHPSVRKNIKNIYRKSKKALNEVTVSSIILQNWPKNLPLVSVVVPYYNAAKTIDETLDSLRNQTFLDFEIVIVNDGSTEEISIEKFASLEKSNPDIIFITQKNQGPAAARNKGVSRAKGKYAICLDSDDWFETTYIEKTLLILETNPDIALVSPYTETFGVKKSSVEYVPYDPTLLISNNMLIHAAAFRKEAWEESGGYKSGIGYEDWEYWITIAEKGYWGKILEEPLFHYRVSTESRYVNDKDAHWRNLKKIKALHPHYKSIIKKLKSQRRNKKSVIDSKLALINLEDKAQYKALPKDKDKILITIPWMTFGGAETLIYNYCREIKNDFDITFITGLKSKNEWEYKFKEITPNIYHLANMFEDPKIYLEFISNYIKTREIDILHIIHNGFTFEFLSEIKKRNPNLKIIVTMFNDRVEYFEQSIGYEEYIDTYVSDNDSVATHYRSKLVRGTKVAVIPNGINCYKEFKTELFDVEAVKKDLGLNDKDLAVFYVGRLSEEKNPDVFLDVAGDIVKNKENSHIKFFMIGDGPMRSDVEKKMKEVNSDRVQYLGYQASNEVARYLSAADIFVLPSKIEGFPLSVLEAMAMKSAVIASNVGAVARVLDSGKDGFVVKPGSAEEINSAVMHLAGDPTLLEDVKKRAREKVERLYSNTVLGENYKKLYKGIK